MTIKAAYCHERGMYWHEAMAAAQRDAERYRWMRAHGSCPYSERDDAWSTPEALDAAIDQDMRLKQAAKS